MIVDLPKGFWYDTVDSTMDEARRLIEAGQIQGTAFVMANHQSKGRGTQGRSWVSPEDGGIYLSVIHLPEGKEHFEAIPDYTLAAGVACVEALTSVTGINAQLKPINDIYVAGKKLGGILVESDLSQQGITALITGVGLNLRCVPRELDRPVITPVSLEELLSPEAFEHLAFDTLVETMVAKICFWYALLFNGQAGQVQRAWQQYRLEEDSGEKVFSDENTRI